MGVAWSASALSCDAQDKASWEFNWKFTVYVVVFVMLIMPVCILGVARKYVAKQDENTASIVFAIGVLAHFGVGAASIGVMEFCPSSCSCEVKPQTYSLLIWPVAHVVHLCCLLCFGAHLGRKGQIQVGRRAGSQGQVTQDVTPVVGGSLLAYQRGNPESVQVVAPVMNEEAGSSLLANQSNHGDFSLAMPTISSTANTISATTHERDITFGVGSLGITCTRYDDPRRPMTISVVVPGGQAALHGVSLGAEVIAINGTPVAPGMTPNELTELIKASPRPMTMKIKEMESAV